MIICGSMNYTSPASHKLCLLGIKLWDTGLRVEFLNYKSNSGQQWYRILQQIELTQTWWTVCISTPVKMRTCRTLWAISKCEDSLDPTSHCLAVNLRQNYLKFHIGSSECLLCFVSQWQLSKRWALFLERPPLKNTTWISCHKLKQCTVCIVSLMWFK